jgi:hypothetical protein
MAEKENCQGSSKSGESVNKLQIDLDKFKKAASYAKFEPSGKPFKEACEVIEKLERTLRSISQLAPRQEYEEISRIVDEALNGSSLSTR